MPAFCGAAAAAAGDVGGTAGTGAGGAVEATGRAGRYVRGSTYPCSSAASRIPTWTYGSAHSGTPLGPIVPTPSPSATVAPRVTRIEPRWVSVTDQPSAVSIVTLLPFAATVPAKETVPAAGARTTEPAGPATSTPRCQPGSLNSSRSNVNGWSTAPSAGHVQAPAGGTTARAIVRATAIAASATSPGVSRSRIRRMTTTTSLVRSGIVPFVPGSRRRWRPTGGTSVRPPYERRRRVSKVVADLLQSCHEDVTNRPRATPRRGRFGTRP